MRTVAHATVTGRVFLLHAWDESSAVCAVVLTGCRGAGFDVIAEDRQRVLVEPEQATSFELGFKTRILDNCVALNESAILICLQNFHALVRDQQPLKT